MTVGMFLAAASFVMAGFVQIAIQVRLGPTSLEQLPFIEPSRGDRPVEVFAARSIEP